MEIVILHFTILSFYFLPDSVICFPNAKINLGLHVTEKRPDGYHNIETVFCPVSLSDALEVIPSEKKGSTFTSTGIPIPGDPESNLVLKALELIRDTQPGIVHLDSNIHLHKVIPIGAGLGGGSSDAAYMLKLLNDLLRLNLSVTNLQDLARKLGSDCAFFIENKPMFAYGRGDQFEPIDLDLSEYKIVVVVPPVHVSTQEAYAMVIPRKPRHSLREIVRMPADRWRGLLSNDFEEPVMVKFPVIREVKEELYNRGAVYAAMSGSGAAVFGLFSRQSTVGKWQFDPSFQVYSF